MTAFLNEAQVEVGLVGTLQALGYDYVFGPDIARDGEAPERTSYADVVLVDRLREALRRVNPDIPADATEEAVRKVTLTVLEQAEHLCLDWAA